MLLYADMSKDFIFFLWIMDLIIFVYYMNIFTKLREIIMKMKILILMNIKTYV